VIVSEEGVLAVPGGRAAAAAAAPHVEVELLFAVDAPGGSVCQLEPVQSADRG
jgi:hypothetical protein